MKMELKLTFIFNMKVKSLVSLLFITSLLSCSQQSNIQESRVFCFDTSIHIKIETSEKSCLKEVENIFKLYDKLSDNYLSRDINNVYTINNNLYTDITIDKELYDLLQISFSISEEGATYFNPLCGSLSKKWKESLKNNQVLS